MPRFSPEIILPVAVFGVASVVIFAYGMLPWFLISALFTATALVAGGAPFTLTIVIAVSLKLTVIACSPAFSHVLRIDATSPEQDFGFVASVVGTLPSVFELFACQAQVLIGLAGYLLGPVFL